MTIKLDKDTETALIASIKRYFAENFDDEIGDLMGRDVDRGIDAEPAGGLPGEHVVGDVTFEQAATHLRWVPRGSNGARGGESCAGVRPSRRP